MVKELEKSADILAQNEKETAWKKWQNKRIK